MALASAVQNAAARLIVDNAADRKPQLVFQSVSLSFGATEILRDIDLTIGEGEFVCVVGRPAAARPPSSD